jgi:hypothetical protein
MQTILLILAGVLIVVLYRMLSRGGKTYSYARTQTISFLSDGSEHVVQGLEHGSIIITNKTVLIDGLEYCYKPMEGEQLQAILDYDENGLRSIRVLLSEGEKQFFIEKKLIKKEPLRIA